MQKYIDLFLLLIVRARAHEGYIGFLIISIFLGIGDAHMRGLARLDSGGIGHIFGFVVASIGIPLILTNIPNGIYWLFKKRRMPGFMGLFLILWVLVMASNFHAIGLML